MLLTLSDDKNECLIRFLEKSILSATRFRITELRLDR